MLYYPGSFFNSPKCKSDTFLLRSKCNEHKANNDFHLTSYMVMMLTVKWNVTFSWKKCHRMQWLSLPACYHDACLWPGSLSSPLHIKAVHSVPLSLVPQGLQPLAPNHPTTAALKLVASAKHCSTPWNREMNINWCDWGRRKTQLQLTVNLHRQQDDLLHDTDIPCSYVT